MKIFSGRNNYYNPVHIDGIIHDDDHENDKFLPGKNKHDNLETYRSL